MNHSDYHFHMIANECSSSRLVSVIPMAKQCLTAWEDKLFLACHPSHKHCKSVVVKVITRLWLATWAYSSAGRRRKYLSWEFIFFFLGGDKCLVLACRHKFIAFEACWNQQRKVSPDVFIPLRSFVEHT